MLKGSTRKKKYILEFTSSKDLSDLVLKSNLKYPYVVEVMWHNKGCDFCREKCCLRPDRFDFKLIWKL